MEKDIEEIKEKNKAFEMIFDLLAKTGEPRFVFNKKTVDFSHKLMDLATNKEITDKQFEKISNLIDQFNKLIDNVLKEVN